MGKMFESKGLLLEALDYSWYKRRNPELAQDNIIDVEVQGYKPKHNHFCSVVITYKGDKKCTYIGRVVYNEQKKYWTIDALHIAFIVRKDNESKVNK